MITWCLDFRSLKDKRYRLSPDPRAITRSICISREPSQQSKEKEDRLAFPCQNPNEEPRRNTSPFVTSVRNSLRYLIPFPSLCRIIRCPLRQYSVEGGMDWLHFTWTSSSLTAPEDSPVIRIRIRLNPISENSVP